MENTAEKLTKLFEKHNREFRFDPQVSHRWIVNAFDEYTKTASGSVAAPKEEIRIEFDKEEYIKSLVSDLYQARQQLKEREEALKEFAQILLDYKHSGVEVNIDYLLDKFPYENIKGKI